MTNHPQCTILTWILYSSLFAIILLSSTTAWAYPDSAIWTQVNDGPNLLMSNERLNFLIDRVGPDMRAAHDYHDHHDVYLNDSILALKILHEQAKLFADDQTKLNGPKLDRLFRDAKVNKSCLSAMQTFISSVKDLELWSIKMWDSSGSFPPNGFLDGQFSDLGSYQGCINLKTPPVRAGGSAEFASYCIVAFRPLLPSRRAFHQVFQKEDRQLLKLFGDNDAFSELLNNAQFFHYIYLKTGVCLPSECGAKDLQKVTGLIARRLAIEAGPVHCFSRSRIHPAEVTRSSTEEIENNSVQIHLDQEINQKQRIAIYLISGYFITVLLATLWHVHEILTKRQRGYPTDLDLKQLDHSTRPDDSEKNNETTKQQMVTAIQLEHQPTGLKYIAFHYFSAITNTLDYFNTKTRPAEITCLHGIRVITMIWIICVHTLQYNEWSLYSRAFESTKILQNPVWHPIFNANYVVDNFFLISGLLSGWSTWLTNQRREIKFDLTSSLVGRYLRITPQVLLVSLFYMILPLAGDGPFWYSVTHHDSVNCEKNWWVNLFHLQAFYKKREICNLVSWWISADMCYYIIAIFLIKLVLENKIKLAVLISGLFVGGTTIASGIIHYTNGLTPCNLGTAPQVGEVWIEYVGKYFATPMTHAFPFFFGFWLGQMLANGRGRQWALKWSYTASILASASMLIVNWSSHLWMSGLVEVDNQYISTAYNLICPIVWTVSFAWFIVACHYGLLGRMNRIFSNPTVILISKASFIIYLVHMLIVKAFYGSQNVVIEVSILPLAYTIIGNTVLSIFAGAFLYVTFEAPSLKFQRFVVQTMRSSSGRGKAAINSKKIDEGQTTSLQDHNSAPKIEINNGAPLK